MTTTETVTSAAPKAPVKPKSKGKKQKAKAKVAKGKPGRKPKISDDAKITVLAKKNPRREGSKAFKRFTLFRTGMKVGDYIKKGGKRSFLRASLRRKHISVSKTS